MAVENIGRQRGAWEPIAEIEAELVSDDGAARLPLFAGANPLLKAHALDGDRRLPVICTPCRGPLLCMLTLENGRCFVEGTRNGDVHLLLPFNGDCASSFPSLQLGRVQELPLGATLCVDGRELRLEHPISNRPFRERCDLDSDRSPPRCRVSSDVADTELDEDLENASPLVIQRTPSPLPQRTSLEMILSAAECELDGGSGDGRHKGAVAPTTPAEASQPAEASTPLPKRCKTRASTDALPEVNVHGLHPHFNDGDRTAQVSPSLEKMPRRSARLSFAAGSLRGLGTPTKHRKGSSAGQASYVSHALRPVFAVTGHKLTPQQKEGLEVVGSLATSWQPAVTHLVASRAARTLKLMCAICRSLPILRPTVLDACARARQLPADLQPYLLRDRLGEAALGWRSLAPGYSLAAACVRAADLKGLLLAGRTVHVLRPTTCMPRAALHTLVLAAGGVWLEQEAHVEALPSSSLKAARASSPEQSPPQVLVLAERGAAIGSPPDGFPVYDIEALLVAACTQRLELDRYRLEATSSASVLGGRQLVLSGRPPKRPAAAMRATRLQGGLGGEVGGSAAAAAVQVSAASFGV